jgi:hypothetical protein
MTIVFRVEGITPFKDSKVCIGVYAGEYAGGCAGVMLAEGSGVDGSHPLPWNDMKLSGELFRKFGRPCRLPEQYNCCFANEEALKRWFSGILKKSVVDDVLYMYPNLRISAYRSDDVLHGSFQSVLNGETAEFIESYPLDKYL